MSGNDGVGEVGGVSRAELGGARVADARGAHRWACPHCAVENTCVEGGAADVVECDYCGRVFALAGGRGGEPPPRDRAGRAPAATADPTIDPAPGSGAAAADI